MHRLAAAAIAAIACLCVVAVAAQPRVPSYGRVMCAGTWCQIVPAPAPGRPALRRAPSRRHMVHHHRPRHARAAHAAPRAEVPVEVYDQDGRVRPAAAAPVRASAPTGPSRPGATTAPSGHPIGSAGGAGLVDQARRYLGTNPTGWAHDWCARFVATLLPVAARRVGNPNLARAWERLPHTGPHVGALAIIHHAGMHGHIGVVSGFTAGGNPIVIAGNAGGGLVREYAIDARRVAAYVDP